MHAMFLVIVAMVPLATGEIIAGYLNLISITSRIKNRKTQLRELKNLQRSTFGALMMSASSVKRIFGQTAGIARGR